MSGKQQQDAQEWFILIVDKLHDAVPDRAYYDAVFPTVQSLVVVEFQSHTKLVRIIAVVRMDMYDVGGRRQEKTGST